MLERISKIQPLSINFHVSQSLVNRFAKLTGDFSSLHTDKGFGRRSNFRGNVIHGMLPVAFISTLPFSHPAGYRPFLERISGRFLKPVFADDTLTLETSVSEQNKEQDQVEFEFSIRNVESRSIVTTGYFALNYSPSSVEIPLQQSDTPKRIDSCIVQDALEEVDRQFKDIKRGDEKQFEFHLLEDHALTLYEILTEGLHSHRKKDFPQWFADFDCGNLLATCLLSTFVGMCIPGKYATFIDFQVIHKKLIQWDKIYRFNGRVRFTSPSTRTIVENISISTVKDPLDTFVSGKLTANVNKPTIKMPSIHFLKENALDLQLKDKVVLITGASRGIGETTAKLFALHGAKVVVNYFRGKEDAERIVDEVTSYGGQALAVQADISNRDQVREMVDRAQSTYGTIHMLVNNAVSNFTSTNFLELTWNEIEKDIAVILKGAFHCCQAIIPLMMKNGEGKIVNISTVATEVPPPNHVKYVVAKSGLVGLTRSLAVEFAPHNILVNLVVPSIVETDLTRNVPDMFLERMRSETPMQRNATPIDVARAVITLASSYTPFTTGQKIMVTGGNAPFL